MRLDASGSNGQSGGAEMILDVDAGRCRLERAWGLAASARNQPHDSSHRTHDLLPPNLAGPAGLADEAQVPLDLLHVLVGEALGALEKRPWVVLRCHLDLDADAFAEVDGVLAAVFLALPLVEPGGSERRRTADQEPSFFVLFMVTAVDAESAEASWHVKLDDALDVPAGE